MKHKLEKKLAYFATNQKDALMKLDKERIAATLKK